MGGKLMCSIWATVHICRKCICIQPEALCWHKENGNGQCKKIDNRDKWNLGHSRLRRKGKEWKVLWHKNSPFEGECLTLQASSSCSESISILRANIFFDVLWMVVVRYARTESKVHCHTHYKSYRFDNGGGLWDSWKVAKLYCWCTIVANWPKKTAIREHKSIWLVSSGPSRRHQLKSRANRQSGVEAFSRRTDSIWYKVRDSWK